MKGDQAETRRSLQENALFGFDPEQAFDWILLSTSFRSEDLNKSNRLMLLSGTLRGGGF